MNIERVSLALVRDSAQPRDLVQANVDMLKASMEQVGLIQPIRVRPATIIVRGLGEQGFQIVAGHHRVAAARALGWTEIDAIVDTAEHLQAELMEIDENLCRAELTASQRAQAIRRRKQIWEALHPEEIQVGKVCPPESVTGYKQPPPQEKGFAASTAAVSGESKRSINQHLARADALGDDLERIAGTSLDKGVEMDALKAMPEPERKELIDRAAAGEKVSARVSARLEKAGERAMKANAPEPEPSNDDGPTLAELVDELQAENTRLTAEITALAEADDQKAETLKWHRMYDHAMRRQADAERSAASHQRDAKRLANQVRECCKALGLEDPRQLVPTVKKLAARREAA